jgi:uncharacterized repeat protein (TIGR04052 family)
MKTILLICLAAVFSVSCGRPSVQFAAKVGSESFDCSKSYSSMGSKKSTFRPTDFRLFVRDPKFIRKSGATVDFVLDQDNKFQRDRVALLDFENGTGGCKTESPELHTTLEGSVVDTGDLVGFQFDIGFPESENHLDAATAKAPFNAPGMWWSWTGGYKFLRLDAEVEGSGAWYVHLGSSGCEMKGAKDYQCAANNTMQVKLDGFQLGKSLVTFDVAKLYQTADLTSKPDGKIDFVPGCMSESNDPDCPAIFGALGLKLKNEDAALAQSFVSLGSTQ